MGSAKFEEVPIGQVEPAPGLPNSHIFADAFHHFAETVGEANSAGPISHSILVSGSMPTPQIVPVPQIGRAHV